MFVNSSDSTLAFFKAAFHANPVAERHFQEVFLNF